MTGLKICVNAMEAMHRPRKSETSGKSKRFMQTLHSIITKSLKNKSYDHIGFVQSRNRVQVHAVYMASPRGSKHELEMIVI